MEELLFEAMGINCVTKQLKDRCRLAAALYSSKGLPY